MESAHSLLSAGSATTTMTLSLPVFFSMDDSHSLVVQPWKAERKALSNPTETLKTADQTRAKARRLLWLNALPIALILAAAMDNAITRAPAQKSTPPEMPCTRAAACATAGTSLMLESTLRFSGLKVSPSLGLPIIHAPKASEARATAQPISSFIPHAGRSPLMFSLTTLSIWTDVKANPKAPGSMYLSATPDFA